MPIIHWSLKTVRYDIFTFIVVIAITQYACVASSPQRLAGKRIQEKDYQGAIEVYQTVVDAKSGTLEARKAQLSIAQLYTEETAQPQQGSRFIKTLSPKHLTTKKLPKHTGV